MALEAAAAELRRKFRLVTTGKRPCSCGRRRVRLGKEDGREFSPGHQQVLKNIDEYKAQIRSLWANAKKEVGQNFGDPKEVQRIIDSTFKQFQELSAPFIREAHDIGHQRAVENLRGMGKDVSTFEAPEYADVLDARAQEFQDHNDRYLMDKFLPKMQERAAKAEDQDQAERLFDSTLSRALLYPDTTWTYSETAYVNTAIEYGHEKGEQLWAEFIGPDDSSTCEGCTAAVLGSPWPLDKAPLPGNQECISRCRHWLVVVDGPEDAAKGEKQDYDALIWDTEKLLPDPSPKEELTQLEEKMKENFPGVNWDFEGANIEILQPALGQFEKLGKIFPEVVKKLELVKVEEVELKDRFGNTPLAYATKDGKKIALNRDLFGSSGNKSNYFELLTEKTLFPLGCDSVKGAMAHEFGHQVANLLKTIGSERKFEKFMLDNEKIGNDLAEISKDKPEEKWATGFTGLCISTSRVKGDEFVVNLKEFLKAHGYEL